MKKLVMLTAAMFSVFSLSANSTIINFNNYTIDTYVASQDVSGTAVVSGDGSQLTLTGNLWKSINEIFTITSDTVLKFDFFSSVEGEISGIGFDNQPVTTANTARFFQLTGTDSRYGKQAFNNYDVGDGVVSYTIDVGSFYTGVFDTMFFVMDDDSAQTTSNGTFANIEVCNIGACASDLVVSASEPSSLAVLGAALLVLVGFRRK